MALAEQIIYFLKSQVLKWFTIGFGFFLIILVFWLFYGYQKGSYWNAKRARSEGDIYRAVSLFKETVYKDIKLSRKALLRLEEMDDLLALEALIDLLDLPEMDKINYQIRKQMCHVIRQRTSGTTADSLSLDPYASQEIRAKQKQQWQEWLTKAKEQYNWQNRKFVPKE